MRIWNTWKKRQDVKFWLPILELKRNILQSFDFGGKIGSLMMEQFRKHPLGSGDWRCPMCLCWELSSPQMTWIFILLLSEPSQESKRRALFCRKHQIPGDWGCCLLIIHSPWQLAAQCLLETWLVFCFHCFLSLLLAAEPSGSLLLENVAYWEMRFLFGPVFAWCELLMGNWREQWTSLGVGRSKVRVYKGDRYRTRKGEKLWVS